MKRQRLNFSRLLDEWGEPEGSPLAQALEERRLRGEPVYDFIQANPQEHGFEFPPELLSHIVGQACAKARFYRPDPRGQREAREAIAQYHGCNDPDHVILTPGTSFAYWCCFRILGQVGGNVLCPNPTYPLFDDLLTLASLRRRVYHLHRNPTGRWCLDPDELEFQITPQTCAIVIVSPHNPTGMITNAAELDAVADIARRHNLPIIFDEVFCEFLHDASSPRLPRPAEFSVPLSITLNGLSKMLSLPGMKAGWMVVEGEDESLVKRFLAAVEYALDAFLPVNEIVQAALPALLAPESLAIAKGFSSELRRRMHVLRNEWLSCGCDVDQPEGGVYLPIPIKAVPLSDEAVALKLLNKEGIYVHAGSSYGMPEPYLIITCVPRPPWPVAQIVQFMRAL